MKLRTQVGIVGAGPAGLLLSHLLHLEGIDSVVLEARSRDYVENRVRAGVLEQRSVDLLRAADVAARLDREGLRHDDINLRFGGTTHRIDLAGLTGGQAITVYGQQEVVKDLIAVRLAAGGQILFEAEAKALDDLSAGRPTVRVVQSGTAIELVCDFVAGCDGSHGICRSAVPDGALSVVEKTFPYAWLGILAAAPPPEGSLIYASHERGFALLSMRSPGLSRLYLQCAPREDLAAWSDERIWAELQTRLAAERDWHLVEGPILQRGITGMRSVMVEPIQFGRLFLAGDAAHVVPPTGAKGMNLAMADVRTLARAFAAFYRSGSSERLDRYSQSCLQRVWQVQRFSWWLTGLLHRAPDSDAFARSLQLAELDYLVHSRAAATTLAENYVGRPFDE